jgi:hypothetical protein
VNAPIIRFVVSLDNMLFSVFPAAFFKPSESCSSPNKKSANPPNKPISSDNKSRESFWAAYTGKGKTR